MFPSQFDLPPLPPSVLQGMVCEDWLGVELGKALE